MTMRRRIRLLLPLLIALSANAFAVSQSTQPQLARARYRIEPSDAQLATLPRFSPGWRLPAAVARDLVQRLSDQGFRAELITALNQRIEFIVGSGEGIIVPDPDLLDAFRPEERAAWVELLASHPANVTERWPLSLSPATLARLDAYPEWQDAVERVRRWGWLHSDRIVFSNLFTLENTFADGQSRRRFYQIALGGEGVFLKLVPQPDMAAFAGYWQVQGRYRAIEPFLNAVAELDDSPRLDVAHLLPRLARSLVDTFPPDFATSEDPGIESSFLATDFFAFAPGVERDEPGGLASWLARHCVPVDAPTQYGDIVVFGDPERVPWPYAVVHIADGIVLGRRPTAFGAWHFMDQREIAELNPRLGRLPPRAFRLKRAQVPSDERPFEPPPMPDAWRRRLALRPISDGPAGKLWAYDVLLAPSTDLLRQLPPPDATPVWTFHGLTLEDALRAIRETSMENGIADRLEAAFRAATKDASGRLTVHPPRELVWETPRELRSRLFPHLMGGLSVSDHTQHIPFPMGFSVDEWFAAPRLPQPVRDGLLRLVYPVDGDMRLSDYGTLYHALETEAERLAAQRAALRFASLVVLLEKPRPEEVQRIARYWRNRQGKNVRTLLESFAAANDDHRFLDVIHLLPPIAREFVNTYFVPGQPTPVPSCYWTAFNFDRDVPDQRYMVIPGLSDTQGADAWRELMTSYELIDEPGELGDIIAYRREGEPSVDHVCTFVAEGIVFTKNGSAFSAPWLLARTSDVDATYLAAPGTERLVFRRR